MKTHKNKPFAMDFENIILSQRLVYFINNTRIEHVLQEKTINNLECYYLIFNDVYIPKPSQNILSKELPLVKETLY